MIDRVILGQSPCPACASPSALAAGTRTLHRGNKLVGYLTFVWSCMQCGHEFVDDRLLAAFGGEGCGTPRAPRRPVAVSRSVRGPSE